MPILKVAADQRNSTGTYQASERYRKAVITIYTGSGARKCALEYI
jgi:hypothetical protein